MPSIRRSSIVGLGLETTGAGAGTGASTKRDAPSSDRSEPCGELVELAGSDIGGNVVAVVVVWQETQNRVDGGSERRVRGIYEYSAEEPGFRRLVEHKKTAKKQ